MPLVLPPLYLRRRWRVRRLDVRFPRVRRRFLRRRRPPPPTLMVQPQVGDTPPPFIASGFATMELEHLATSG